MTKMGKKVDPNWDWRAQYQSIFLPVGHGYGWYVLSQSVLSGAVGVVVRDGSVKTLCEAVHKYNVSTITTNKIFLLDPTSLWIPIYSPRVSEE